MYIHRRLFDRQNGLTTIVCPSETKYIVHRKGFSFIFFICYLNEFMQNITMQHNRIETVVVVSADNRFQYYESIAFPCPNGRIKKNYNNQMLEDDFITTITEIASLSKNGDRDGDGYIEKHTTFDNDDDDDDF